MAYECILRNGLAIMPKLKPGIQPSTSLLVCKRDVALGGLKAQRVTFTTCFLETSNTLQGNRLQFLFNTCRRTLRNIKATRLCLHDFFPFSPSHSVVWTFSYFPSLFHWSYSVFHYCQSRVFFSWVVDINDTLQSRTSNSTSNRSKSGTSSAFWDWIFF